jgi:hypothetical protein
MFAIRRLITVGLFVAAIIAGPAAAVATAGTDDWPWSLPQTSTSDTLSDAR